MPKEVARLEGGLIVRKGDAAPATAAPSAVATSQQSGRPAAPTASISSAAMPKGIAGTIAITVRLDPERYERLKMHGARHRETNQQIMVNALDAYLAAEGS